MFPSEYYTKHKEEYELLDIIFDLKGIPQKFINETIKEFKEIPKPKELLLDMILTCYNKTIIDTKYNNIKQKIEPLTIFFNYE